MKKGKFLTDVYKKIDGKSYNVRDAVNFFVESKRDKFDETIEVSMNLGIDNLSTSPEESLDSKENFHWLNW